MPETEWPPLREVIAEFGLRADKRFGQHYLLDTNLLRKIADEAGPWQPGITAYEVGPGPGGLTRMLLERAERVITVEADARFLPALQGLGPPTLTVHHADALKVDEPVLIGDGAARIAANLPYNVASPLLARWLLARPFWWLSAAVMVQREVGDRLTAQPGEKTYGRLSVLAQAHAQVRQIMAVPARAFVPPPQIASSVIRLEPREHGARVPGPALERVTAAAFGQRRKMLRSSLKVWAKDSALVLDDVLGSAGLRPDQRAETVPVEAFIALAEAAHVKERKSR